MNIIIPMAGLGKRFSDAGFELPKPLIPVLNKAMYRHAVDCLPLPLASRLIFVVLQNDFCLQLIQDIAQHYSQAIIVQLSAATRGQAETVLQCADEMDMTQSVLIHNCDTAIATTIDWQALLTAPIDGALVTFPAQESRWSYAQLAPDESTVIDVQEKKVISNHASTGTYFFKQAADLLTNIRLIIQQNWRENNEFYLSTIYRLMIAQQKKIINIAIAAQAMRCFGTPPDLVNALNQFCLES